MKQYCLIFLIFIICLSRSPFIWSAKAKMVFSVTMEIEGSDLDLIHKIKGYKDNLIKENNIKLSDDSIHFWANEWRNGLQKFLKSYGYYSSSVGFDIVENQVAYKISTGEQYVIGDIRTNCKGCISSLRTSDSECGNPALRAGKMDCHVGVKTPPRNDGNATCIMPTLNELEIKTNEPAIAEKILNAQKQIGRFVEDNNCLLYFDVSHQAFINHAQRKIDIVFLIDTGPTAYIDHTDFIGLSTINAGYAHKLVDKHATGCFKYTKILKAKSSLQKSGLFFSVKPIIPKTTEKHNKVDVKFEVKERKHRTIKAGLKYSTDLGLGITGGIEHRNLFGNGEKLTNSLSLTKSLQNFDTILQIPFFLRDNQTLRLQNIIEKENLDAYNNREISILAALEQVFFEKLTIGEGIKYGISRIRDTNSTKNFALLAIPLYGKLDFRNNILDPIKGALIKLEFTPYYNTLRRNDVFYKKQFFTSVYLGADTSLRPTLALLGKVGSIDGTKTNNIPATERFFAGGAGSIRGYKYQSVGPLNANNDPLGGNSMIEISAELRLKVTDDIGIVGFIDGGNVFSAKVPKFKEKLLYAGGFGARYYTNFGPLRADIAFPLKKRHGVDRSFQIYFSIGQAF
jgi:translocation and assembly module TamA